MAKYKNITFSAKTFYGVVFEPGEVHEVPGFINSQGMVRVLDDKPSRKPVTPRFSEDPAPVVTRGRKKKSNEPEKVSVAETEIKITETPKEENN